MQVRKLAAGAAAIGLIVLFGAAHAMAESEATLISRARQLIFDGKRSGEGYFSSDGRFLIFQSERDDSNPFYQIYIMNLESGEVHLVSPGGGKTTCAFFRPDGNRVLYSSTHLDPEAARKQKDEIAFRASGKERRYSWDYDENFDVFASATDGTGIKRMTESQGYDAEGSWSPDGKRIVFCSMRNAYPPEKLSAEDKERLANDPSYFGEIYIMNADGSAQTRLTDESGYDGGPFFSPDGTRIIWRHFTEDGTQADIYTMRLDGRERVRVTDFSSMCWAPYFHPSGRYVIFTTNKLGFSNFELYVVDVAGAREPVRVTYTDGFDGLPVFSPDGTRIAWTSNRTTNHRSQIYMGRWNHEEALRAIENAPARGRAATHDTTRTGSVAASLPVAGYTRMKTEIDEADLRAIVEYLAGDELDGRLTGSTGERAAADFIAARFRDAGLLPAGDDGTWFQSFPFVSGVTIADKGNALSVTDAGGHAHSYEIGEHFRPMAFSENAAVSGDVVFAGYGLTTPGDGASRYDSYSGIDVKGKVVVVLRYVPEDVSDDRRAELNRYANLRYKAMLAREHGATALLVGIGPNSPNAGELTPMQFDRAEAGSGIPVIAVRAEVLDAIFTGREEALADVQKGLDGEDPHATGSFAIEGAHVSVRTELHFERATGRNVVGFLPPGDGSNDSTVVVVGAHYDHLGRGTSGSLAHKDEEGQIHNGADDNASGTSVMMELASALAQRRQGDSASFRRGLVFAAWSGEELGIIGSNYFTEHPSIDAGRIAAYVNFDMVGRLRDEKLVLQGTGSAAVWNQIAEKRNVAAGFDLTLQSDPYLPTDTTPFYQHRIPVLSFFTGSHDDYHRPTDDAATLDYDGMRRIANFADGVIGDLVSALERPQYVDVPRSREDTGARASMRAYLGTIPDYAGSDVEGVKLSGVRSDGPADRGGLRGGDVIVEFAGRSIRNIYDYTYALDAIKIGEPVVVVVLREGLRLELSVTPEARK